MPQMGKFVKNWRNLHISNPKPDLNNINAHTKLGENPLTVTQVIIQKWIRCTDIQQIDGQIICLCIKVIVAKMSGKKNTEGQITNLNQILIISMDRKQS